MKITKRNRSKRLKVAPNRKLRKSVANFYHRYSCVDREQAKQATLTLFETRGKPQANKRKREYVLSTISEVADRDNDVEIGDRVLGFCTGGQIEVIATVRLLR